MRKKKQKVGGALSGLAKAFRATSSARIFKRVGKVSKEYIGIVLSKAAGQGVEVKEKVIRLVLDEYPQIKISYVVFARQTKVPFLIEQDLKDINHGFLLLLEVGKNLFCFYSKAQVPLEEIEKKYLKSDSQSLANARLSGRVNLQKIRTKAMINTFDGCHNRTFEGQNLQGRLGSRVNHRQIVTSTSVRKGSRRSSVHFSLSKITDLGGRRDLLNLLEWADSTAKGLDDSGEGIEPFLSTYAQECELPTEIEAKAIVLHDWEIQDYFDLEGGQFVTARGGERPVPQERIDKVMELISKPIELLKDDERDRSYLLVSNLDGEDQEFLGRLDIVDQAVKIKIRGFHAIKYLTTDGKSMSLNALIDKGGHFSVVFDDPTYYFSDGRSVRDQDIVPRSQMLLNIMNPIESLSPEICRVENGHSVDGVSYPEDSIFCVLDEALGYRENAVLVCDDGGTEWADFLEFENDPNPQLIFYHAKKGKATTLGASAFHELVAQALKHLGQATRKGADFLARFDEAWSTGERHGVDRFRCQFISRPDAREIILQTVQNPLVDRKVCLVVNFLSKSEFSEFLENPDTIQEHQVQQIWLLNEFASSCWDLGLTPEILCAP